MGSAPSPLYREVTGKPEPTMVILMDSYESEKDRPYETDLFKLFMPGSLVKVSALVC